MFLCTILTISSGLRIPNCTLFTVRSGALLSLVAILTAPTGMAQPRDVCHGDAERHILLLCACFLPLSWTSPVARRLEEHAQFDELRTVFKRIYLILRIRRGGSATISFSCDQLHYLITTWTNVNSQILLIVKVENLIWF